MHVLESGTQVFYPIEFIELLHQYDGVSIASGDAAFLEIRVPTKRFRLKRFGRKEYISVRTDRKRNGYTIEICGNKLIFTKDEVRLLTGKDNGVLSGTLKSDCSNVIFHVVMYKEEER